MFRFFLFVSAVGLRGISAFSITPAFDVNFAADQQLVVTGSYGFVGTWYQPNGDLSIRSTAFDTDTSKFVLRDTGANTNAASALITLDTQAFYPSFQTQCINVKARIETFSNNLMNRWSATGKGWKLAITLNGALEWLFVSSVSQATKTITTLEPVFTSIPSWKHICIRHSLQANEYSISVDGALATTLITNNFALEIPSHPSNENMKFGGLLGTGEKFAGSIARVLWWDSSVDMIDVYAEAALLPNGLVSHLSFEDQSYQDITPNNDMFTAFFTDKYSSNIIYDDDRRTNVLKVTPETETMFYLESSSTMPGTFAYSLCAWVKFPLVTGELGIASVLSADGANGWFIYMLPGRALAYQRYITNTRVQWGFTASGAIPTNTWTHVCGVLMFGTTLQFYLNGATLTTLTIGNTPVEASSVQKLRVGGIFQSAFQYPFNTGATIDEVRYYNRLVSASQIQQIYQKTTEAQPSLFLRETGLTFNAFMSGSTAPVRDQSGQRRLITLSGQATTFIYGGYGNRFVYSNNAVSSISYMKTNLVLFNNWSICMWVIALSHDGCIMSGVFYSPSLGRSGFLVRIATNGKINIYNYYKDFNGAEIQSLVSTSAVHITEPLTARHVCVTQTSNMQLKLYIGGVNVPLVQVQGQTVSLSPNPLTVRPSLAAFVAFGGSPVDTPVPSLIGQISHIRTYNYTLTPTQIYYLAVEDAVFTTDTTSKPVRAVNVQGTTTDGPTSIRITFDGIPSVFQYSLAYKETSSSGGYFAFTGPPILPTGTLVTGLLEQTSYQIFVYYMALDGQYVSSEALTISTVTPTTAPPTQAPTTRPPITQTPGSTTNPPTGTTQSPTTQSPTTQSPTVAPTTQSPTTSAPTGPTTQAPTIPVVPVTTSPPTVNTTMEPPVITTSPPTTQAPTTNAPTTSAPTTTQPPVVNDTSVVPPAAAAAESSTNWGLVGGAAGGAVGGVVLIGLVYSYCIKATPASAALIGHKTDINSGPVRSSKKSRELKRLIPEADDNVYRCFRKKEQQRSVPMYTI